MTAGSRKLVLSAASIVILVVLGALAGALDISDPAVASVSSAIQWVVLAFCGGNGVEHVAQALAKRATNGTG